MSLAIYIEKFSPKQTSERREEIERIAIACGVSLTTVYRWVNGSASPNKLTKDKLSELTGIPVENLFTSNHENQESIKSAEI